MQRHKDTLHKAGQPYCSKDPSWTDKLYNCIHEISKAGKGHRDGYGKIGERERRIKMRKQDNEFRIR